MSLRLSRPLEPILAASAIALFGMIKLATLHYVPERQADALLPISAREATFITGILEIGLAMILASLRHRLIAGYATLGLGLSILLFRSLYVAAGGAFASCPCLGGVPGLLPAIEFYRGNILTTFALWIPMLGWAMLLRLKQEREPSA